MIQAQGRRSFYDSRMGKARQFRVSQRTVELFAAKPMKHSGEFLMACVLLLITLPLILIVALAIKLESPGPVFERRQRSGFNCRPFQLLSFRMMAPRPEPSRSTWQPTLVGQFLKSTRIDALPQLFNVVRGELSLMETTLFD
jgi:lipopolysaccharide/colanic/teichoic acid biosynthesis glycosyltransferase